LNSSLDIETNIVAITPRNQVRGEKIAQIPPARARPQILLCRAKIPPTTAMIASITNGRVKIQIKAPEKSGTSRLKKLDRLRALFRKSPIPNQPMKWIAPATIVRIPPAIGFQVLMAKVSSFRHSPC
jgi:hypothetical protein